MADVNTAADVSKINAAEHADEDEKLEYTSTKEDTVFNAYVTIATVYAAGEEPQSWRDQEPRFPCRLEGALTEVSSLGLTTGPSKLPTNSSRDATSGLALRVHWAEDEGPGQFGHDPFHDDCHVDPVGPARGPTPPLPP